MKKTVLLSLSFLFTAYAFTQQLYSNFTPVNYYKTGNGQLGTPKVIIDDVQIPNSTVGGADSLRITKLNFIIARLANAPATTVTVYYTPLDDTATFITNLISIPPINIGTISIPAQGASGQYRLFSLGDSINTLFSAKTDTGALFTGLQTIFIGISFSDTTGTGWAISSGGTNYNRFWIYNADSTVPRAAYLFSNATPANPNAAFGLQVFGYGVGSLPVTLSNFKGERKGNVNVLNWTTASEQNNSGFEIQRSADGKEFTTLTNLPSKGDNGNSNQSLNYSFTDKEPLIGSSYYRLKQVDFDGKFKYSGVVVLKGQPIRNITISNVYPNPSKDDVKVIITSQTSQRIQLMVTDLSGKVVLNETKETVGGDNVYTLNVRNLAKGNYYIKAICADDCEDLVTKFIKN